MAMMEFCRAGGGRCSKCSLLAAPCHAQTGVVACAVLLLGAQLTCDDSARGKVHTLAHQVATNAARLALETLWECRAAVAVADYAQILYTCAHTCARVRMQQLYVESCVGDTPRPSLPCITPPLISIAWST